MSASDEATAGMWFEMPEVRAVRRLRDLQASDREVRLFLTFVSAIEKGKGDARELRADLRSTQTGKARFPLLKGPKLAPMWVRIMAAPGGAVISNMETIPVAVDVHVRRVTENLGVTDTRRLTLLRYPSLPTHRPQTHNPPWYSCPTSRQTPSALTSQPSRSASLVLAKRYTPVVNCHRISVKPHVFLLGLTDPSLPMAQVRPPLQTVEIICCNRHLGSQIAATEQVRGTTTLMSMTRL